MSRRELWVGRGGRAVTARSETVELDKALAALHQGDVARAIRVLTRLRKQVAEGIHQNPPLVVYGNPPMRVKDAPGVFKGGTIVDKISDHVHAIMYEHVEDGKPYKHDFDLPTAMFAIDRGGRHDVLLTSLDGNPIWQDF